MVSQGSFLSHAWTDRHFRVVTLGSRNSLRDKSVSKSESFGSETGTGDDLNSTAHLLDGIVNMVMGDARPFQELDSGRIRLA